MGVFEQFILLNHTGKFIVRDEEVISPVNFLRAREARGCSNDKMERQMRSFIHWITVSLPTPDGPEMTITRGDE